MRRNCCKHRICPKQFGTSSQPRRCGGSLPGNVVRAEHVVAVAASESVRVAARSKLHAARASRHVGCRTRRLSLYRMTRQQAVGGSVLGEVAAIRQLTASGGFRRAPYAAAKRHSAQNVWGLSLRTFSVSVGGLHHCHYNFRRGSGTLLSRGRAFAQSA